MLKFHVTCNSTIIPLTVKPHFDFDILGIIREYWRKCEIDFISLCKKIIIKYYKLNSYYTVGSRQNCA